MKTGPLASRFEATSRLCARICIGLGVLVIIGWHSARFSVVVQLDAGFPPMRYDTALTFIVGGAGLLLALRQKRRASLACGVALTLLGAVALIQCITGIDVSLHAILARMHAISGPASASISVSAAVCITLIGAALVSAEWHKPIEQEPIILVLAGALVSGLGLVAFAGYVGDLRAAYGWGGLTRMALHAAAGFMLIGVAVTTFGWGRREATELNVTRLRNAVIAYACIGSPLTVLVAAMLATLPMYDRLVDLERRQLAFMADHHAKLIAPLGDDPTLSPQLPNMLDIPQEDAPAAHVMLGQVRDGQPWVVLLDHDDRLRTQPAPQHLHRAIRSGAVGETGLTEPAANDAVPVFTAYRPLGQGRWVVIATMDAVAMEAALNQPLQWIALAVVGLALLSAFGMYLLVRPLTGEILVQTDTMEHRITDATEALQQQIKEYKHLDAALARQAGRLDRALAERDRLNTELNRSNQELEQFAYVASHDLQEPLRMVASYVQLLERRYKDKLDDDATEFIAFAVDGAKRMQTLINDLLRYSRVATRGEPFAPTDLNQTLATAMANLEARVRDTDAQVTLGDMPTANVDAGQIARLLQNLIGNALKFCDKDQPRVDVDARRDNNENQWVISIRDNGIGIDPKFADRVFVIFQRLHTREHYEGTGIGLAVCKRIVERHGGRIWFESQPGEGTTFYFTLPDQDATETNPDESGDAS